MTANVLLLPLVLQVQEQLQEAMAALDRLAEENALLEQRAHAAEQAAGEASRAGEQQLMSQQMVVEELTARLEGAEGKLEDVEKLGEAQGRVVELERQVGEKGAEVQALEAKLLELQHQVGSTSALHHTLLSCASMVCWVSDVQWQLAARCCLQICDSSVNVALFDVLM